MPPPQPPRFDGQRWSNADDDRIEVLPADPAWPQRFAAEAEAIRTALALPGLGIEHVGSTAVPARRQADHRHPPAAAARPRSAAAGSPAGGPRLPVLAREPEHPADVLRQACRPSAMAAPTMSMSCPWPRPTATCCSATGCATTPTTPTSTPKPSTPWPPLPHRPRGLYPWQGRGRRKDSRPGAGGDAAPNDTEWPGKGEREMHARELRETLVAGAESTPGGPADTAYFELLRSRVSKPQD